MSNPNPISEYDEAMEQYEEDIRKENYWRGFRACLFITIPIIVFLMVVINILIENI